MLHVLIAVVTAMVAPAHADYAMFGPTDTILVNGHTTLGTQATFEARIWVFGTASTYIYNEHAPSQEDKMLAAGATTAWGFAWPNNPSTVLQATTCYTREQWQHVAYVLDGTEERLYLDGELIATRLASGDIGDSESSQSFAAIGAIKRADLAEFRPGFLGVLDSLRISDVAVYEGETFDPPTGDLAAGPNTVLLFNFNEPTGSAEITDESGRNITGTLGVGFPEATPPELTDTLPPPCPIDITGDRVIGFDDLVLLLGNWGGDVCNPGDVNGDGAVNFDDLVSLLGNWGPCAR
jgi:hypothetical protein